MIQTLLWVLLASTALVLAGYAAFTVIRRNWNSIVSHLGRWLSWRDASVRDWDRSSLIYRVPSSMVGFLLIEYILLWIAIGVAAEGLNGLSFSSFFSLWHTFLGGLDSLPGLIGAVGILIGTVYGVFQDLPEHRLRVLGVLSGFGVLVGLGLRFD